MEIQKEILETVQEYPGIQNAQDQGGLVVDRYIKRWRKVKKGTPAYAEGYRWFDAKTMKHHRKLPVSASMQVLTKYSPVRHG